MRIKNFKKLRKYSFIISANNTLDIREDFLALVFEKQLHTYVRRTLSCTRPQGKG
jgi:hypothetical protein